MRPRGGDVPILRLEDVRKSFGGVQAVRGASFSVAAGSITGLIGPNGAGKTTTFDLINQRTPVDAGKVWFDGEDVTGCSTHHVARQGLVRTFQVPRAFVQMTVWENLLFAGANQPGERFWRGLLRDQATRHRERELAAQAGDVLAFLELEEVADLPAASLSGGQRKLLELARALMSDPKMIMLDEPTAGVAPALTEKLVGHLRRLRDGGTTLLIVEHDLDMVLRLVDHLVVMHIGAVLLEGEPDAVRQDERVLDAYLGGTRA